MNARFDWFQATVAEAPEAVGEALLERMPGAHAFDHRRGRQNYHHSTLLLDSEGDTLVTILHGGPNGDPNACASGRLAEPFADIVRELWPEQHRVTRLDSAVDLHGDFYALMERCRAIGAQAGVSGRAILPDDPEQGATYYMGASTSRVQQRLYEKGKQMAGLSVDPSAVARDWVRFETQWRPDKQARCLAATVTPDQVWGVSPWLRSIAAEMLGIDADRLRAQPQLLTTFERRHAAMIAQYGNHLRDLLDREGSPEVFLSKMLADLGRG